ncbi:hypothetical protein QFC21_003260 [Naganishia friedmannii]|uniref:Uncharacterized protein n=1 Tax=Naganishia friedmannii TaxID=89922 RepID=A0ACC2VRF4_9TREE|nr:hypothetical protein QFC21_003260 [Naganishia friedmannii]
MNAQGYGDKTQTGANEAASNIYPPHSSYSVSALPQGAQNFGTSPSGIVGQHFPKEIIRIERDWTTGEVCHFHSSFPMELEGRITPIEFRTLIDDINKRLQSASSQKAAVMENILAILTWHTSLFWWTSRYEKVISHIY